MTRILTIIALLFATPVWARACHLPFLFIIVAISLPHWSIIGANAFQWFERENKNLVETQAKSGYTELKHP